MTRLLSALTLILAVAACGSASSPTGPAPANTAPPTATTAVISGTVSGAASAGLFTTNNGAAAGMTVTVQGTNITTTVNGTGQFQLTNVPPGTIVLVFSGAGANAQLNLGAIPAGTTVTINVVVSGSSATLEEKTQGNDREIEGRIESIAGSTLRVAGRTVTVGASTVIRHGNTPMTLTQLAVGQRVHVKGIVSGTGTTATTAATLIIVQNMNTSIPVNLDGTVSGLTGTASAFQFTLDGRTVRGTSATEFKGGRSPSFAGLANGDKVHVKGTLQEGFVLAERINLKDDDEDDADEFEVKGAVSGLSGTCPAIAFTLNATAIRATTATEFKDGTCASIANGDHVEVEGTRQPDGSVVAKKIEIEDDDDGHGNEWEASGAISGLSGTCPAITFTLAGKTVRATSSTHFKAITCSALANGTKVEVEGTTQPDGSVVAREIKKD